MILNKYEKKQFIEDWKELPMDKLQEKYGMTYYLILEKAKMYGLPKREKSWWPESKVERFKKLYPIHSTFELESLFDCSHITIYNKARKLKLIKTQKQR